MRRVAGQPAVSEGIVVTKATLRAAGLLGISNKALARIVGLSEASVSRMGTGTLLAGTRRKAVRTGGLVRALLSWLDAIVHGDDGVARAWLSSRTWRSGERRSR